MCRPGRLLFLPLAALVLTAQTPPPTDVTAEGDPTSATKSFTLQYTYTGSTYGPGSAAGTQLIPRLAFFSLGKSLVRLSLPRIQTIGGTVSGMGDMQLFYLFQRPAQAGSKFLGVFAQFPTASNPLFGTGKWLLGPAGAYVFAFRPQREILGILVQTGFSFAGAANRRNQSIATVLPFYSEVLGGGWYLKLPEAPWVFDLQKGASLIPLGLGVGRIARLEDNPVLISVSDETTVVHANAPNAPKNTARLTFTFLARATPRPR